MKSSSKWSLFLLIIFFMGLIGCNFLNKYQRDGSLHLSGLKESVKVLRDEKGMAYIYAGNTHDALMAQGFVTAQDDYRFAHHPVLHELEFRRQCRN